MNDESVERAHEDFGPFDGRVWLNCAHQGPLPKVAVNELLEAIKWKVAPHHLTTSEKFLAVPQRLRRALGRLLGVAAEEVILGNSTSYGLHLLANGLPLKGGDEVLLVEGDFPSCIRPWLALQKRGVLVRFIKPQRHVLQAEELEESLSPRSKLLCTTWVHSFSGYAIDVNGIGEVCRAHNINFVLNSTQALGARPLDLRSAPVDAVASAGHKWLCGPYGTGLCWMRKELMDSLDYNQAYWLALQTADDLGQKQSELTTQTDLGARAYDVFGTANFFNFKAWRASVEYVLARGVEQIEAYDNLLVSRFIDRLDLDAYDLISPPNGPARSTLIFISHKTPEINYDIYQTLVREKVDIAYRRGNLRIAPHLYNTPSDIDRAVAVLNSAAVNLKK